MNEWMNEWCIYIALYCVLLYTQSALQSCGGVSHQPPSDAVSWAVPHHSTIVCLWGKFGGLLRPRGTTYTPLRSMFSHSLIASSNVVIHKFLRNSCSALQPMFPQIFFLSEQNFSLLGEHFSHLSKNILYTQTCTTHAKKVCNNFNVLFIFDLTLDVTKWCIFTVQYTAVQKVGIFGEKFLGIIKAVSIC